MNTKITTLLGAGLALLVALGSTHSAIAQASPPIVFHAPVIVASVSQKPHRVSYTTNRQVFTINYDGSGLTQLTTGNVYSHYPSWSPDHEYIAFMRGAREIHIMDANGGRVFFVARGLYPDWSPDRSQIVFEGEDYGLHVVDVDPDTGSVGTPSLIRVGDGACIAPQWSPDGRKIAFSYNSFAGNPMMIKILDLDTGNELSINPPFWCGSPCWSPDGSMIAFSAQVTVTTTKGKKTTTSNYKEIFLANPDGTEMTQVTDLQSSMSVWPTWSPDGTALVFSSSSDGYVPRSLYAMPLDTGTVTLLQAPGDAPNWAP